jgi:hypothetical protein
MQPLSLPLQPSGEALISETIMGQRRLMISEASALITSTLSASIIAVVPAPRLRLDRVLDVLV